MKNGEKGPGRPHGAAGRGRGMEVTLWIYDHRARRARLNVAE